MFRNLTRFDALLGFGGYTHCTQIRGGLSQNFVDFRRALVLGKLYSQLYAHECYQQTFESPCHWSVCSHGQCFHFLPIIFLPNIYWTKRTGGPLVLLWFHAPGASNTENTWIALGVVPETPTTWGCPSGGINHHGVTELLLVFQSFCRFEAESEHFDPSVRSFRCRMNFGVK